MSEFYVKWEIDIDADTAEEAARKALEIQRNAESECTVFSVVGPYGERSMLDLTYGTQWCVICEKNEVDIDSPVIQHLGAVCHDCFNKYAEEHYK